MRKIYEAEAEYDKGVYNQSLRIVETLIENGEDLPDAYFLRAKIHFRHQNWKEAINDLNQVLEVQPENQSAWNYRGMIEDILAYGNKDQYNP